MTKYLRHTNLIRPVALTIMILAFGCGKETPATPNEKTEKLLQATTWTLSSLKVDGAGSSRYSGMTLNFGIGTYNTSGGEPVWPAEGTWAFEGQGGDKIRRSDGLMIDVLSANAAQITLAFDWTETTYDLGRSASLAGRHEMVFMKK